MKHLFQASLVLFLASAPALAQKMGSANTDAPVCSESITFKSGETIKLEYQASVWGKTIERAMDKEKGERARTMINTSAEKTPIGAFSTSSDIQIGDKAVASGDYTLAFTINAEAIWHLVLVAKSDATKKVEIPLQLHDAGKEAKRLRIDLAAGETSKSAELSLCIGKLHTTLTVAKSAGKSAEPASHGK